MGVQMNIKNAEVVELAHEVAGLTGESLTQALLTALKDRKRSLTKDQRMARIRALIEESGKLWTDEERNIDHTAFLYDEMGLPK
jgi:antitoxin VapB